MGYKQDDGFEHAGTGPGFGLSTVFPVVDNFFLLGNISGLYIWGDEEPGDNSTNEKEKYIEYADGFYKYVQDTSYYTFLNMNSDDHVKHFRKVQYRRMKTIKPIELKRG